MTLEELKRYDRAVINYRGVKGMLYLFDGSAYFLNNVLSGLVHHLWSISSH